MASTYSSSYAPIFLRQRDFQWYWKKSGNSGESSASSEEDWLEYTDIDNEILEDAYNAKKTHIELDGDRFIDFTQQIQYKKGDAIEQQGSIKRMMNRRNIYLRENRFSLLLPISSELRHERGKSITDSPNEQATDISNPFDVSVVDIIDDYADREISQSGKTVENIVEEAARGILIEGQARNKINEAQWLSQQLLAVKTFGRDIDTFHSFFAQPSIPSEIGETCVHLYTRDSFWYKLINQITREPQSITDEHFKTLGPFAWLLQCYLKQILTTDTITVYRGLNLTEDERKRFTNDRVLFPSFTSTTKNRILAEWFGNTLLIIDLDLKDVECGSSIAHLSNFPEEEEFLLWTQTWFNFVRYEYDGENKKYIIFLKVSQNHVPTIY
jgi:hypothetical protein